MDPPPTGRLPMATTSTVSRVESTGSLESTCSGMNVGSSTKRSKLRRVLLRMVEHPVFNLMMVLLSISNATLLVIDVDCEASSRRRTDDAAVHGVICGDDLKLAKFVSESLFTVAFILEFTANMVGELGCRYACSAWGMFDTVFAAMSIIGLIFLYEPPGAVSVEDMVPALPALRIFDIFRLSRGITFLILYSPVWTMVKAWMGALIALAAAAALAATLMFTFAVVGVSAYSETDRERWGGVLTAWFTLIKLATFDDWTTTMAPVFAAHPCWGMVFVASYFLTVPFTVFPLVTAILTQQSVLCAEEEVAKQQAHRDAHLATVKAELEQILEVADTEGDGDISKQDLRNLWNSEKHSHKKARTCLREMGSLEELEEIFDFLSFNDPRQTAISRDEFFTNMLRYRNDKTGFLLRIALQHLGAIKRRVLRVECKVECQRGEMREVAAIGNPFVAQLVEPRKRAEQSDMRVQDKLRAKRLKHSHGANVDVRALRDLFESVDQSKEGLLNKVEFAHLFEDLHERKPGVEFKKAWRRTDADQSGSIDFDEFLDIMISLGWYQLLGSQGQPDGCASCSEFAGELHGRFLAAEEEKMRSFAESVTEKVSKQIGLKLLDHVGSAAESAAKSVEAQVAKDVAEACTRAAQQVTEQMAPKLAAQLAEAATAEAARAATVAAQRDGEARKVGEQLAAQLDAKLQAFGEVLQKENAEHEEARTVLGDALKALRPPKTPPRCEAASQTETDAPAQAGDASGASPRHSDQLWTPAPMGRAPIETADLPSSLSVSMPINLMESPEMMQTWPMGLMPQWMPMTVPHLRCSDGSIGSSSLHSMTMRPRTFASPHMSNSQPAATDAAAGTPSSGLVAAGAAAGAAGPGRRGEGSVQGMQRRLLDIRRQLAEMEEERRMR
eukprot:CAMPEP_0203954314 /NCGR_PEP_ID=MMETSP0359-20131031/87400_1 /ASSEMBLY_ACC=CAM_ASM_000338 /TAXON_ID=268821 /ORGANISM="Scrippsiella Hangoei, Strain SHTV-5" /LENGTH=899 /DNA_ID=CAMNT_0050887841 /DNA_START=1 /DNA_END=2700 /DNA_ORIENTATION=-